MCPLEKFGKELAYKAESVLEKGTANVKLLICRIVYTMCFNVILLLRRTYRINKPK